MATIKNKRRPGRPPKNLVIPKNTVKESVEKKQTEEQLILYLPNFDDENTTDKNNFGSLSDSDDLTDNNTDNTKLKYLTDKNNSDKNNSDEESIKSDVSNLKNNTIDKLINELHKKDAIIINLKSKLKDKNFHNENNIAITKENKKKLLNIGLISINNNKLQICEKTDIACWWCTYNFDTSPLFLPDHYKNNIYYVFGNFCGFSCILAYNENLDDYRKSVRSVLIKQLYREIFQNDIMLIKPSGPRELLKKFGGPLDISQYRDPNNICIKTFKMSIPPMVPLISDFEEINFDK
jgi:hypothetical protein